MEDDRTYLAKWHGVLAQHFRRSGDLLHSLLYGVSMALPKQSQATYIIEDFVFQVKVPLDSLLDNIDNPLLDEVYMIIPQIFDRILDEWLNLYQIKASS
jgi:hypothetical protein